ncbi:MAG TPA: tyrosinase family protein [Noviherbaspirillum sp.]|uniref:tyrosinase family protein n=1 Tax=Noviherbaspirillum sp. TaxID=1926288 RepID=UPI002D22D485|nr:tyrosinase family protein [Noviherbaspirillum sp.]HYD95474.1 tyrosinase family protein [Noviherbaspirillum sp.]
MSGRRLSRRNFIKGASALMLSPLPLGELQAQTGLRQRLDWNTFRNTRDYASLMDGIARMRQNTDAADKRSWAYWVNVHQSFCPHGVPYFLAWHRAYLYFFEQQLRAVSGNNALVLPYWDYYTSPEIPAEFTNPASYNSLYAPRLNTSVIDALTLAPFSSEVTDMQRGLPNSFEVSMENAPHNPVHNIIGNVMADMQSPTDPIFWLHHANVDRLWTAWAQGGGGREMPASTDSYWNGTFTFANRLTMQRSRTISTRNDLGYFYQNEQMPTSLPVARAPTESSGFKLASFGGTPPLAQLGPRTSTSRPRLLSRPPTVKFPPSAARATGANRRAIGGVLNIPLSETSVSTELIIDSASSQLLQTVVSNASPAPTRNNAARIGGIPYRSAQLVLDSVSVHGSGEQGGYFYQIYVNLPSSTDVNTASTSYLVGSTGPFEIAAAHHRVHMNLEPGGTQPGTVRLVFPVTLTLKKLLSGPPGGLTISFVRVSGNTAPAGDVMHVGEARLELSLDPVQ